MNVLLVSLLFFSLLGTVPKAISDSLNTLLTNGGRAVSAEEYEKANTYFIAALQLDSTNVKALRSLGVIHATIGDQKGAQMFLKRAYALDPKDAITANNLGASYATLGKSAQAVPYYEQAVAAESTNSSY